MSGSQAVAFDGLSLAPARPAEAEKPKYAFVDALRGYAVLLVITCHTGGMFAELPYPLKKLTNLGWHGVQLFFLVSCVTLMISWRDDEAKNRVSVARFWHRRFFRIAPMYFLAALFYFIIEPPPGGFDPTQLLASFAFVNAWHPTLIPTTPGGWMVVPGGWSIGVEFTFYMLFPLIAMNVRSPRGALMFCVIALALGCVLNPIAYAALVDKYGVGPTENFIYFWFPNQLSVFALGTVLFVVLTRLRMATQGVAVSALKRYAMPLMVACFAAAILIANIHLPHRLPFALPGIVPALLAMSLVFMLVTMVLAASPDSVFVNHPIRALGTVSFSAYLLHFAVLHQLPRLFPSVFDVHAVGWAAIATFVVLWVVAVGVTFALSSVTYRLIESPMIDLGRRLQPGRLVAPRRHGA